MRKQSSTNSKPSSSTQAHEETPNVIIKVVERAKTKESWCWTSLNVSTRAVTIRVRPYCLSRRTRGTYLEATILSAGRAISATQRQVILICSQSLMAKEGSQSSAQLKSQKNTWLSSKTNLSIVQLLERPISQTFSSLTKTCQTHTVCSAMFTSCPKTRLMERHS